MPASPPIGNAFTAGLSPHEAAAQLRTDVAHEAAAIVLLDDNFSSIGKGIRLGRHIFGNPPKSMRDMFAVHIPIAGKDCMGWWALPRRASPAQQPAQTQE